ncbi:O-antigen ligase [Pedobacter westerhofensis]|uniref:O-antigen ligase n=1 Tax=Pedobacter westerhofensis TaxID=425512 RepID=A0A521CAH7_9SPHI|nr:O-antigen ligase family protein [Pedobacter westerhofensis]SMO55750.1 O-antigen ligase [Pedobacter westerhofensis]
MKKIIPIIVIIAFFCSCTNFIPVSAIASPLGLLLFPLSFQDKRNNPKFIYIFYLFLFVSFLSVCLYDSGALLSYDFYRYDGNVFISYAPLLLIPLVSARLDVKKLLIKFIYFETALNLIVFIGTIVINNFQLNAELSFGSLFIARNAAGGFLSFCVTCTFLVFWNNKNWKNFIFLGLNIIFLFATYSRGSMLGLGFCITLYLFFEKNMGKLGMIAIAIVLVFEVFLVMQTFDFYKRASSQIHGYDYVTESFGDQDTKGANISIRLLYNWPSGIDEFIHSPIFGAGFGSLNDRPYIFNDKIAIVNPNLQRVKSYNDAHAHNTYFHIGGEQGILGLVIFLLFLISLYLHFNKHATPPNNFPLVRNVILLYILNIAFMSLTEHRLTSPSNVLPLTLLIVLFFSEQNHIRRNDNSSFELPKVDPFSQAL